MSVTINGVVCEEIVRGYSEGLDRSLTSSKSYLCPWDKRGFVIRGMIGYATFGVRNGRVTFNGPFGHPEQSGLYAKSISIQGVGRPFQGPAQLGFAAAIIAVEFGVLEWSAFPEQDPAGDQQIDPDTKFVYCTQDISYGATYETIPGSKLQLLHPLPGGSGFGTYILNKDMSIKVAHAEMTMTFHKLPYMPTNFLPLIDNVNADTFLRCDRGTVKFNGGTTHREEQVDGTLTQSVSLSLSYRPKYPWNFFPDPFGGSLSVPGKNWAEVQYRSGDPLFPYSDLSTIFPPGYLYS